MRNVDVELGRSTRAYRNQFRSLVGVDTYNVVRDTLHGFEASEIAERHNVPVRSVAAIRANLTRGAYEPFVSLDRDAWTTDGLCDFGE